MEEMLRILIWPCLLEFKQVRNRTENKAFWR